MHAFPSIQDTKVLWGNATRAAKRGNPLAILSFPLIGLVLVVNLLSIFWFDYLYGIALGILLPRFLLERSA